MPEVRKEDEDGVRPVQKGDDMRGELEIRPITFKEANCFVQENHRHHGGTIGCKFCLACYKQNRLVGVAICGRPVSRYLDDGLTLEINRLCTTGIKNTCSILYGAACRVAKEMGYKKVVTYTLESENGASLKASNFKCAGIAGAPEWTGKRKTGVKSPHELKKRWERAL